MLGIVAGPGIGLGALYFSIVASNTNLSFATIRVVGGLVFSLGLAIVLVGGAELFTGDNLIVMAWASGRISTLEVLRNWVMVYCGNFVGGAGLAVLVLYSHHLDMNGGRIALTMLNTAVAKISPDVATLFFKGILCNLLVCFAVWLAAAGRSVTDKIIALILPISAFVTATSALRGEYVFPADGLAFSRARQCPARLRRLANHDIRDHPQSRAGHARQYRGRRRLRRFRLLGNICRKGLGVKSAKA